MKFLVIEVSGLNPAELSLDGILPCWSRPIQFSVYITHSAIHHRKYEFCLNIRTWYCPISDFSQLVLKQNWKSERELYATIWISIPKRLFTIQSVVMMHAWQKRSNTIEKLTYSWMLPDQELENYRSRKSLPHHWRTTWNSSKKSLCLNISQDFVPVFCNKLSERRFC